MGSKEICRRPTRMTEWIGKSTRAMDAPWSVVILEVIETAGCARFQCASDHRVEVVAEQFNLDRGRTYFLWAIPGVLGWLGEEERGTRDLQTGDWREAPQFCGTEACLYHSTARHCLLLQ